MARDNRLWEKNNLNATQSGSRDEPTVIAAKYCYETYKLKITGHVRELAPTGGEDSGSTGEEMTFDIEGGTISKFCKCTSIDPTDPNAGSSSDSFKLGVGGSFTYEKTTRMLACGGLPCYLVTGSRHPLMIVLAGSIVGLSDYLIKREMPYLLPFIRIT